MDTDDERSCFSLNSVYMLKGNPYDKLFLCYKEISNWALLSVVNFGSCQGIDRIGVRGCNSNTSLSLALSYTAVIQLES